MTTSCATIDDHSINRTFSFHCTVSLRNPQRAKSGLEPEPVQCLPASEGVVLVQFWFIVHCGKIISVKCDIYSLISIWLFTGSAHKSARDRVREMYKSVLQWLKMPVASAVLANGHPVICNCDGSSASGQVFCVLGNKEICSCVFYHFSILKWCKRLNFSTENIWSSIWQLCRHCWHCQLLLRQLTVPTMTTKLSNWRARVLSVPDGRQGCNSEDGESPVTIKLASWQLLVFIEATRADDIISNDNFGPI